MTPDNNPAAALHAFLDDGSKGARGRVAAMVGESSPEWSLYCTGKRTPGVDRLMAWTKRTGTWLVCTGHSWTVTTAPKEGRDV